MSAKLLENQLRCWLCHLSCRASTTATLSSKLRLDRKTNQKEKEWKNISKSFPKVNLCTRHTLRFRQPSWSW